MPDRSDERQHLPETATPDSEQAARFELLGHIQALLEPLMIALGIAFLAFLFVDLGGLVVGTPHAVLLSRTMFVIWAIFLADFLLRFIVAPEKLLFLRGNWLTVLSLAIPFLRPFRALRAIRAIRSLNLVRLLGGVNRGMRIARRVSQGHQFAYVGGLTVLVVLTGAVGVWFFDRGHPAATIDGFGSALWWSSTLITTINNEQYPVTLEARILAVLMRVYAVSVFGFITATIASYLVEQRMQPSDNRFDAPDAGRDRQLEALRLEIHALRAELQSGNDASRTVSPS
ncbi:MAG TPA: ion transporter [Thermomicrobiales bacterium]|nr:ion transporter [Thermomicrobiales bacterium]